MRGSNVSGCSWGLCRLQVHRELTAHWTPFIQASCFWVCWNPTTNVVPRALVVTESTHRCCVFVRCKNIFLILYCTARRFSVTQGVVTICNVYSNTTQNVFVKTLHCYNHFICSSFLGKQVPQIRSTNWIKTSTCHKPRRISRNLILLSVTLGPALNCITVSVFLSADVILVLLRPCTNKNWYIFLFIVCENTFPKYSAHLNLLFSFNCLILTSMFLTAK